ncbi:hypothetical protein SAMN06265367_106149 [Algoriphagus winogradskyi]|uniref:Uncharacterized protein n=1 Tax=Algoriphagus winogradskyi TaxID=237017 RepID=A0ABY1P9R3_9BACT|nr:hypothetical protein SAMN06265367_106149 [Algoriphagus winogradskyi]
MYVSKITTIENPDSFQNRGLFYYSTPVCVLQTGTMNVLSGLWRPAYRQGRHKLGQLMEDTSHRGQPT